MLKFRDITPMFPETKCLLNWVPGKQNSADLVSKFFKTPVLEAGGDFYRHSGFHMMLKKDILNSVFFELSLGECVYSPLPLNDTDRELIEDGPSTYVDEGKI